MKPHTSAPNISRNRGLSSFDSVWATERLLFDGDAFFDALLRDIDAARHCVDLETYIFRGDKIGQKISAALVRAAARGVRVRLIVDGIGASGWFEKHAPELETKQVAVRIYHPVMLFNLWSRLKIDFGFAAPKGEKIRGSALMARLNRRDHRKMCVIDRAIGYVGSVNVTDDHRASVMGARAWRDTSVRVEGTPVRDLVVAFDDVWDRCHDAYGRPRWRERMMTPKNQPLFSRLVRFNYTSKLRRKTYKQLIRRISRARTRVWITNPYFAPGPGLLRALKQAAQNGADVRILVPRISDVFFMPWVSTAYYASILKGGAKIYEYLPRMLHAKTSIVDNWMIVGSSNFNRRSIVHDFEVDLVLGHKSTHEELVAAFQRDLKESEQVTTARGGLTAWVGRFISLILKNWI